MSLLFVSAATAIPPFLDWWKQWDCIVGYYFYFGISALVGYRIYTFVGVTVEDSMRKDRWWAVLFFDGLG